MPARRVLLIDDDDDVREVAQVSLELVAKWDVLTAGSGAEGIERAAADQPDAIVLDVMMPNLDGPTTLKRLHANRSTRHIPVVFLTATAQHAADRERLARLGALGVIAKPFDPLQLPTQIATALGWSR